SRSAQESSRGRERGGLGRGPKAPASPAPAARRLLAQSEPADHRKVPFAVGFAEIVQQAGAFVDHLQQAAATGVIFLVLPHVLGQLVDASGEQSDLHLRGAGVAPLALELLDELGLALLRDRHLALATSARVDSCSLFYPVKSSSEKMYQ